MWVSGRPVWLFVTPKRDAPAFNADTVIIGWPRLNVVGVRR